MAARIFGVVVAWLLSRTNIGVSRLNILEHRSCHEKRRTAGASVIIRDQTSNQGIDELVHQVPLQAEMNNV